MGIGVVFKSFLRLVYYVAKGVWLTVHRYMWLYVHISPCVAFVRVFVWLIYCVAIVHVLCGYCPCICVPII